MLLFKKPFNGDSLTLGQQLRSARRRRRLRIADVVSRLKIRVEYIEALENDQFNQLPGLVYSKQFVKAYAAFLGLSPSDFLEKINRQEKLSDQSIRLVPSFRQPKFFITPKLLVSLTAISVFLSILGYVAVQLNHFAAPPTLKVFSPHNGDKIATGTIDIVGQTDPGSIVSINSEPVAQQPDGAFRQAIQIAEGVNTLEIVAENRFNKRTNLRLSVVKPSGEDQAANY